MKSGGGFDDRPKSSWSNGGDSGFKFERGSRGGGANGGDDVEGGKATFYNSRRDEGSYGGGGAKFGGGFSRGGDAGGFGGGVGGGSSGGPILHNFRKNNNEPISTPKDSVKSDFGPPKSGLAVGDYTTKSSVVGGEFKRAGLKTDSDAFYNNGSSNTGGRSLNLGGSSQGRQIGEGKSGN